MTNKHWAIAAEEALEEPEPMHPDQPTKGQLALNGARLALAQLAVDAETLIHAWRDREKLLEDLPTPRWPAVSKRSGKLQEMVRSTANAAVKQEIARCRHELQQLLKLWEPK